MQKQLLELIHSSVKPDPQLNLNILFVDDDDEESYLFNEAVEHARCPVKLMYVHSVSKLFEQLKINILPDLVFLDLKMPYKDGVEALQELRAIPEYNDLKIVIYSTASNLRAVRKCYDAGADLFVEKPEDFDDMVKIVKKICDIDWRNFKRPPFDSGFILTP